MKVSIYSTLWGMKERPNSFDIADALSNWSVYADEISIACGDQYTYDLLDLFGKSNGYPIKLTRTQFDFASDSYAYGKTENAALQACTGDLLIQQNMDERIRVDRSKLVVMHDLLQNQPSNGLAALWVPTIDLYGSLDRCLPNVGRKWYVHRPGLYRGSVTFAIKADGRPDYNKTSSDELIDREGHLALAASLLGDYSLGTLSTYVSEGWPLVYHLGYVSLTDRLERSLWWKAFWEKATGGDPNQHPTSVAEMAVKATVAHGLPLWPTQPPVLQTLPS